MDGKHGENMMITNAMEMFKRFWTPPVTAIKKIIGGRLKGFSSIDPIWRYECFTDMFGLFGDGWWYEIVSTETISPEEVKESLVVVTINFFYKVNGIKSEPLVAFGASKLVADESNGLRLSDEAHKGALTDALGVVACRLGVGGAVYSGQTDKYQTDSAIIGAGNHKNDSNFVQF
jgi:hypothetical protein